MDSRRALLVFGTVLLSISALLGFVQAWYRNRPEAFVRWRVVHSGGTAGAVQLLVVSALWDRLTGNVIWQAPLACGLIIATYAFFLGPLSKALGQPRLANTINVMGAIVAVPTYVALPAIFVF
jgi:vacuolar-type H+-ATPase subunit I/STV1